jgi:hypothetical protein
MRRIIVRPDLLKAQVQAFVRKDGVQVGAHDNGRTAVNPIPHPKGHQVGHPVMFPHPLKPGKKALGKYSGERDGQSVISHDTLGQQQVPHDQVFHARGVAKPTTRADVEAAHTKTMMAMHEMNAPKPAPGLVRKPVTTKRDVNALKQVTQQAQ